MRIGDGTGSRVELHCLLRPDHHLGHVLLVGLDPGLPRVSERLLEVRDAVPLLETT